MTALLRAQPAVSSSFVESGGMIGPVLEDRKIRFEINLDEAHRARRQISSRLLQLARTGRGPRDGGG